MIQKLKKKYRTVRQAIRNTQTALDARAAVELSRLDLPYLPWPGSAIAPSSLCTILNEILINNRKTVVEFGSGISTLYIARILQQTGGHITSIESDPGWAVVVKGWIATVGLEDHITMVDAPLAPCSIKGHDLDWYQEAAVISATSALSIDCILVDGPPAYQKDKNLARYPALPIVYECLSDNCVVFLDDISRDGEQQIQKKWSTAYPEIKFGQYNGCSQIARGIRGPAFSSAM